MRHASTVLVTTRVPSAEQAASSTLKTRQRTPGSARYKEGDAATDHELLRNAKGEPGSSPKLGSCVTHARVAPRQADARRAMRNQPAG